jgi:hypothetical protein
LSLSHEMDVFIYVCACFGRFYFVPWHVCKYFFTRIYDSDIAFHRNCQYQQTQHERLPVLHHLSAHPALERQGPSVAQSVSPACLSSDDITYSKKCMHATRQSRKKCVLHMHVSTRFTHHASTDGTNIKQNKTKQMGTARRLWGGDRGAGDCEADGAGGGGAAGQAGHYR